MSQKQEIEKLTHGVNTMLTLYLEVHNRIFAQPWWRSIPIPGLFKSIPFDKYEIQISKVEQWLREMEGSIRSTYEKAPPDEKRHLTVLHQYTVALLKSVIAISPIVVGLKGKTDNKPYDIPTYNADVAAYKEAEKGHCALGEVLNHSWRTFLAVSGSQARPLATADDTASLESCRVHVLDAIRGLRVENWRVGEQVSRETYDKFKDQNGHLYMVVAYEKGEPQAAFAVKAMWDQVDQQFKDIEVETAKSFEKTKRDFGLK